jgi:anti-sigma B factor antagonist
MDRLADNHAGKLVSATEQIQSCNGERENARMNIRIETGLDVVRLIPDGDIDHEGAEAMKAAVAGLSLSGKTALVLDFKKVSYIGSAGLGKLLLFYKRLASQQVQMRVEFATPAVQSLLRELRLDTLFSVN